MNKFYAVVVVFIFAIFTASPSSAQGFTHAGKEFWVGYGHHQFMENLMNTQEMVIYITTGDSAAVVTLQLDSSGSAIPPPLGGPWTRTYTIPANTAISIEDPLPAGVSVVVSPSNIPAISPIPKGLAGRDVGFDARLYSCPPPTCTGGEGLFRKHGIHITSTAPIVAYAHIYGSVSSGATILIPVESWGYSYTTINSQQQDADNAYSWVYIVARQDNTWIHITPSVPTRNGRPANVTFDVQLNKGQIYQVVGMLTSTTKGYNLTGTKVQSFDNGTGSKHPIAVFAGSSRTSGEDPCAMGGRDNDMQQVYPEQAWGKNYLTAPFSNSDSPSSLMNCVYKIVVVDTNTVVKLNGVPLTGLIDGKYYKFVSSTADYIEADRPVMVAQFMGGGCVTGGGDPEMIYLSPIEQAITKTRFYRNTKEAINVQALTLIIPTAGVPSLKIDGVFFANIPASNKYSYPHPALPGYTVIVREWPAAKTQSYVESLVPFTGITYGLGGAESYGYNVGGHVDNLNIACFNNISGYAFLDKNANNIKDNGEPYFNNVRISTLKAGMDTFATITSSGIFNLATDTGFYTITATPYVHYYNVVPAVDTVRFPYYYQKDSVAFAIQPLANVRDLSVYLVPTSPVRPYYAGYNIFYQNQGTDTAAGTIEMVKSSKLGSLLSASDAPAYTNGDTLRWSFTGLKPSDSHIISLNFFADTAPAINIGDTLISKATISLDSADVYMTDNTSLLTQIVTASYDPNDKIEKHGGTITSQQVADGEYLQYTIRFQNTGNDTAGKVYIRDTLDDQLDWSSLRMVTASHTYQLTMNDGKNCLWAFDNINLPDSNINEPLSHGYLTYLVKPKTTLSIGDTIRNRAGIYFDANPVVLTKINKTTVSDAVLPLKLLTFTARRDGKKNLLQWNTQHEVNIKQFEVERSANATEYISTATVAAGTGAYRYTDVNPAHTTNYYRLKIINSDGAYEYSPVRMVNNNGSFTVSVYPNPAKNSLQIMVESEKKADMQLSIATPGGNIITTQKLSVTEGQSIKTINTGALPKGNYFLLLTSANKEQVVVKFEKI